MNFHVVLQVLFGVTFVITERTLVTLHLDMINYLVPFVFAVVCESLPTKLTINFLGTVNEVDMTTQKR